MTASHIQTVRDSSRMAIERRHEGVVNFREAS